MLGAVFAAGLTFKIYENIDDLRKYILVDKLHTFNSEFENKSK